MNISEQGRSHGSDFRAIESLNTRIESLYGHTDRAAIDIFRAEQPNALSDAQTLVGEYRAGSPDKDPDVNRVIEYLHTQAGLARERTKQEGESDSRGEFFRLVENSYCPRKKQHNGVEPGSEKERLIQERATMFKSAVYLAIQHGSK